MECGHVGILSVDLHLPEGASLKTKRRELQRLRAAIAKRLGCAVAEVDHHDLWQRAGLTLAMPARSAGEARDALERASRMLSGDIAFQVVGEWRELVDVDGEPVIAWEG